MGTIVLEGMEFHAFHGCFAEEQLTGTTFVVDLYLDTDTSAAELSDNLKDTVDYAAVYKLVKKEMMITSKLLEHVGHRIIEAIKCHYPEVDRIELKISKISPPVGGKIQQVGLILSSDD